MHTALQLIAGALLGLGFVGAVRRLARARREALIYATALVAAAMIYAGCALAGRAGPARLAVEFGGVALFASLAVFGLRRGAWPLAAGWAAHAAWDGLLHAWLAPAAFVPAWYPATCAGFDLSLAALIAARVKEVRMTMPDEDKDDGAPRERGGVGDVESAGETTAAAAIKGPDHTKPVGAGTKIDVSGDRHAGDENPPRH